MSKINNTINRKTTIKNKFQNTQQRNYKKTNLIITIWIIKKELL